MGIQVTLITELVTTKTMIHMRSDPGPSGMREAIKSARPKGRQGVWNNFAINCDICRYLTGLRPIRRSGSSQTMLDRAGTSKPSKTRPSDFSSTSTRIAPKTNKNTVCCNFRQRQRGSRRKQIKTLCVAIFVDVNEDRSKNK